MRHKRAAIAALCTAALATLGTGVAYAATSTGEPPSPVVANDQVNNTSVFECFNGGKLSYAEFRLPLPHTCWFPGDVLVQVPASTVTFKVTVPKAITGGTADLAITETCTTTVTATSDAENPVYTCTVTSP